jgi:hypothetical protein
MFAGRSARGKTSMGWFYGFKLHLVVDDQHPVPKLAAGLVSKLFGDKGYRSQPLAQHLLVTQGLHLNTLMRKKKHNRLLE